MEEKSCDWLLRLHHHREDPWRQGGIAAQDARLHGHAPSGLPRLVHWILVRKWFDGNLLSRRGRTSKMLEARELHSRNPGSQYRLINV